MILLSLVTVTATLFGSPVGAGTRPGPQQPSSCQFPQTAREMIPFANDTRQALERARARAFAGHRNAIGPADVALGILGGDDAATRELDLNRVDTAQLARRLRAALPKERSRGYGPDLPYDEYGKAVLCFAIRRANKRSTQSVTTLDLLVGLAQGGSAEVMAALRRSGIDSAVVNKLSKRH